VLKVRRDQKAGDYSDPGWFKQPSGTQAYEWTGALAEPARFKSEGGQSMSLKDAPTKPIEVTVKKPTGGHGGH
jgi:manganese oxidase